MSLVDVNGNPLETAPTTKRRRQKNLMKKQTAKGDVLFQLIVDLPEGIGEDEYNRIMVEYFGIGYEAFKGKAR